MNHSARRGRWSLYLLWLVLIVVAIGLGIGLWLAGKPREVRLQGTVEAEQINVATKVLARVEKLNASLGQSVKAGEVLAVLSSPELTGAREQAAGTLAMAEAQRKVADDIARPEDVAAAHAVWQAAQAQAQLAAVSAKRAATRRARPASPPRAAPTPRVRSGRNWWPGHAPTCATRPRRVRTLHVRPSRPPRRSTKKPR